MPMRPFQPCTPSDLPAILTLAGQCNAAADFCVTLQPGDIRHFVSNRLRGRNIDRHLWVSRDDAGANALAVVMIYDVKDPAYTVMIHPQAGFTPEERHAVYSFAEARVVEMLRANQAAPDSLGCEALGCDTATRDMLLARGYTASDPWFVQTSQPITGALPDPVLPEGFSIRPVQGLHEAAALAELHNQAFSRKWDAESYAQVMQAPGFEIDHELVVVAPDGTLAAFCVYWIDPIGKSGLFEPVGCAAEFRRRSLTSALLREGMRRMQAEGAETAFVNHEPESANPAAAALYQSLGFRVRDVATDYRFALTWDDAKR
jgi:mycothiol synthase